MELKGTQVNEGALQGDAVAEEGVPVQAPTHSHVAQLRHQRALLAPLRIHNCPG